MEPEKTVTIEETEAVAAEETEVVSEVAVDGKSAAEEAVWLPWQYLARLPGRERQPFPLLLEAKETADAETETEAADETEQPAEPKPTAGDKAKNIVFTVIRIVLVAALVFAVVYFVFLRNQTSDTPASVVFEEVTKVVTTDKMEQTTDRYFKKYYGLNAADYEDVLYYAPVSNMDAEELLIVKLKNTDQAEAVTEAILKRQADKEQSFEGYAPEQYALAQQYILDTQGNYILFVIDPKAEEIDAAFAGAL